MDYKKQKEFQLRASCEVNIIFGAYSKSYIIILRQNEFLRASWMMDIFIRLVNFYILLIMGHFIILKTLTKHCTGDFQIFYLEVFRAMTTTDPTSVIHGMAYVIWVKHESDFKSPVVIYGIAIKGSSKFGHQDFKYVCDVNGLTLLAVKWMREMSNLPGRTV